MNRVVKFLVSLLLTILAMGCGYARAEEATPTPSPTPTPDVVTIEAVETPKPDKMNRPDVTIYDYNWGEDMINTAAKLLYAYDTFDQKFGALGVAYNRYMSNAKNRTGDLVFGSGTFKSVVTQRGEFPYDDDFPVTDENYKNAKLILNILATSRLTKKYTGYPFPSTALYYSLDGDSILVYSELGGEPFRVR